MQSKVNNKHDILEYPIIEDINCDITSGIIRQGTAATSLDCILLAFNGHGGFGGGRGEPSLQWAMESLGLPDNPKRIAVFRSLFSPMITCAELVGAIDCFLNCLRVLCLPVSNSTKIPDVPVEF